MSNFSSTSQPHRFLLKLMSALGLLVWSKVILVQLMQEIQYWSATCLIFAMVRMYNHFMFISKLIYICKGSDQILFVQGTGLQLIPHWHWKHIDGWRVPLYGVGQGEWKEYSGEDMIDDCDAVYISSVIGRVLIYITYYNARLSQSDVSRTYGYWGQRYIYNYLDCCGLKTKLQC